MKTDEIYRIKQSIKSELIKKGYSEDEVGNLLEDYPELIRRLNTVELPDWFKEHLVCWYDPEKQGCTNENMDVADPILKDFNPTPRGVDPNTQLPTGEKCDMHLKNFGWSRMSGIGGYTINLGPTSGATNVTIEYRKKYSISAKINSLDGASSLIIPIRETIIFDNRLYLNINGMKVGQKIEYRYYDGYKQDLIQSIEHNGIIRLNEIPQGAKVIYFYLINPNIGDIINIESLPLYPNALVFDGVDDYGISENQPKLTDYTVIAKRKYITLPNIDNNASLASKLIEGQKGGEFRFELFSTKRNKTITVSFTTINEIELNNTDISFQTSKKYNNKDINSGDTIINSSNRLTLGSSDISYRPKVNFALYRLLLFDITLTQEQIDYVKYIIMGEPLPEPIAKWSAKGKTNEDADKDVLKDLTGNGHDIVLKNFAFSKDSGYGGYGIDFMEGKIGGAGFGNINGHQQYKKQFKIYNMATIKEKIDKIQSLKKALLRELYLKGYSQEEIGNKLDNIPKLINDLLIDDIELDSNPKPIAIYNAKGKNNDDPNKNVLTDLTGNGYDILLKNFNWTKDSGYDNPLYPNALIFDGSDDYGICNNFPALTKEKGYTIIAKRKNLGTDYTSDTAFLNKGAFTFEDNYNNQSTSFGEKSVISLPEEISWQTSKSYNHLLLYTGNAVDTNTLLLGSSTINSGFWKGAFYELHIFDLDLSEYEINRYIKRNINTNYDTLDLDILSYGVLWDSRHPETTITRIGNPKLHKSLPILSSYRGCVAKGKQIQYYLDSTDWSKKVDGTPSVLNGTDGDVRIHIMKFYGKSFVDGTLRSMRISTKKIDDTWTEIPEMLIDAYRCTIDNTEGKTVSVVNTDARYRGGGNRSDYDQFLTTDPIKSDLGKPRTSVSRANMRNYAKKAGSELLCYEYYKWIFCWNYVIEYANFNSQANFNKELTPEGYHQGGLGMGITTMGNWAGYNVNRPLTPCGFGNSLGNGTGIKDLNIPEFTFTDKDVLKTLTKQTLHMPRWRGFDNPFGDIWTNLDGFVAKREAANEPSNIYTTTDSACFDDQITNKTIAGIEIPQDGYIKDFALGSKGDIIPSVVGGSASQWMSDYHYCNPAYTGARTLLVGSSAHYWSSAGFGCFSSIDGVGLVRSGIGFRTLIRL